MTKIANEEYITKSEAIEAACNAVELFPSEYREIENAINSIPATDVMEVVRCRECLCYTPVDDNIGKCVFLNGKHQYVVPDGYCYLGELKEGAD